MGFARQTKVDQTWTFLSVRKKSHTCFPSSEPTAHNSGSETRSVFLRPFCADHCPSEEQSSCSFPLGCGWSGFQSADLRSRSPGHIKHALPADGGCNHREARMQVTEQSNQLKLRRTLSECETFVPRRSAGWRLDHLAWSV